VRFAAIVRVYVLRPILRLWCAAFCAAYGPVEVILGRLSVVLQAHLGVMAHPQSDNVDRERIEQFGFTA
jgi:hypothetical protein